MIIKVVQRYTNAIVSICLLILLFHILWLWIPANPGYSQDTIPNALLPLSLIREKNFDFNEFTEAKRKLELIRSHAVDDVYYFVVNKQGKVVSNFPVFTGIIATPIYIIYSHFSKELLSATSFASLSVQAAAFLTATLLSTITAYGIYALILHHVNDRRLSIILTLFTIFGTEISSTTSRFLFPQTTALLCLVFALLFYERKQFILLIIFSGLAFIARPSTSVITLPFIFFLAQKTPYFKNVRAYTYVYIIYLIFTGFVLWYASQYMDSIIALAPQYTSSRFTGSLIEGLTGILFSPSRGLFVYGPVFLFAIIPLVTLSSILAPYTIGIILYTLLIAKWDMWWGGYSHGYRMLLELIPLLAVSLSRYIKSPGIFPSIKLFVMCVLMVYSIIIHTYLGSFMYPCGFDDYIYRTGELHDSMITKELWSQNSEIVRCWNKAINN